jgi:hypothetical protein
MRRIVLSLLSALLVVVSTAGPAFAQSKGAVAATWKVVPLITSTVTPNYQSGFGPTGGSGSGSTPAVGPSAVLGSGFVDFGSVIAGFAYLYKFAAKVSVTTNDASGFKVYGEGSTDFNGASTGTQPISTLLFWLQNNAGNTPFSAATPFQATTFPTANAGKNITYGAGFPPNTSLVWSSATGGTISQGYDYEIRLPSTIPTDTFSAFVVYTVIGN